MNGHGNRDLLAFHILIAEQLTIQQARAIINLILEKVSTGRGHRLWTNCKLVCAVQLDIIIAGIVNGNNYTISASLGDPDIVGQIGADKPAEIWGNLIDDSMFITVVDNAILDVVFGLFGQGESIQCQFGNRQFGRRPALVAAVLDVASLGIGSLFRLVDKGSPLLASVGRLDGSPPIIRVLKVDKKMNFFFALSCVVYNALGGYRRPQVGVIIDLAAGGQYSRAIGVIGQHGDIGGFNNAHFDIGVE